MSTDGPPPRTWTIEDHPGRPVTMNALVNMHRMQWAGRTKTTRKVWAGLALQQKIPRVDRCEITVTPLHKDNRSPQDTGACAPALKAAVDGLMDAGVLLDDNGDHVLAIHYLPPDICGADGLRIYIQER